MEMETSPYNYGDFLSSGREVSGSPQNLAISCMFKHGSARDNLLLQISRGALSEEDEASSRVLRPINTYRTDVREPSNLPQGQP